MSISSQSYRETPPCRALAPYVDCFWTSEVPASSAPVAHRVLPDGCIDFIFDLSPSSRCEGKVVGTMTRALLFEATGAVCLVAVRFRPGGATPFLDLSAAEITDRECDLPRDWRLMRLADQLKEETTPARRVRRLESALLERLPSAAPVDQRVQLAVAMLGQGGRRVGEVAATLDVSRQHLNRLFRDRVGVGPKCFDRVARLQRLLAAKRNGHRLDWSRAALDAGYCDQAHLANECRELTGLSPTELASR